MPSRLINAFLLLTSFFVFMTGMVGLNFYNTSKTASRVSRLNYTSFVGYVMGLGVILFYVGTMNSMGLSASVITGYLSLSTLLVWTMCAMMLSDMKKENKQNELAYKYTAGMLAVMLILFLGFTALTFTPAGRLMTSAVDGKVSQVGGMSYPLPAQFGKSLNSPLYGFGRRH